MEIEAKFDVTDRAVLERIEHAVELAGFKLGEPHRFHVEDTYLDTKRRRLYRQGYCLRLREQGGNETLITIKGLDGGKGLGVGAGAEAIHHREEYEITLPGSSQEHQPLDSSGWPRGATVDLVERLAGKRTLATLCSIKQERTMRPVLDAGTQVAELSMDDVEIGNGETVARFSVVEVELEKGADESKLESVAAQLRGEPGLSPSLMSKLDRALELIDAESAMEAEPTPPAYIESSGESGGILLDDSLAEAARKTLDHELHQILDHEDGTREGIDEEELHDMRVATRRMRAALKAFEPYLNPNPLAEFSRPLRRLGRALGGVRDLDVFRARVREYLDGLPAERRDDLDPLMGAWEIEYQERRETLLHYLDGKEYARLKRGLGRLLEHPLEQTAVSQPTANRVRQLLPGMLFEHYRHVWAFDGWMTGPEVPLERYHDLRIASKGLRYALEFFENVLPPKGRDLIKQTKLLQDHLGDLQDAVVACHVLRDFLQFGTWGPRRPGEIPPDLVVAPGVAAYLADRQARLTELTASFPAVWPKIVGPEAGRSLGAITSALIR